MLGLRLEAWGKGAGGGLAWCTPGRRPWGGVVWVRWGMRGGSAVGRQEDSDDGVRRGSDWVCLDWHHHPVVDWRVLARRLV